MTWCHLINHAHLIQKSLTELKLHPLPAQGEREPPESDTKVTCYTLSRETQEEQH